jgi:hypothetical protein
VKPLSLTRRMRRALGFLTTLGTVGAIAPTAFAGPVVDVGASWTSIQSQSGPFTTSDGGNTISAPGGGASIPAGSHLQTLYCNQYGANTQLVGATVRRVRWHATANDITAFMRIQGPDGVDLHNRYLYNQQLATEMQKDTVYDDAVTFPAGQCFYGGIYAGAATNNLGFTTLVTNQIQSVKVEDLQGPAVANPTSSTQWFTGDVANIEWDQSDNQFLRGNTYAQIVGGGTTDLGNTGNGHVGTFVGVGTLTDGQHQICAYRSAQSALWATAGACTVFKLDRSAPGTPAIALTPDTGGGWTNQDVTITTAQTNDGTGSGWNRNQLNVGGTGWADGALSVVRTTEGDSSVAARAVDAAGLVSAPSQTRQVRIDKTPPTAALTVDGQSAPGLVSLSTGATADALSGLRSFAVHLGTSNGPIVATSAPELIDLGQSAPAKNAGTTRFVLVAQDNAGNVATATSPAVRLDAIAPSATLAPLTSGWVRDFALAAGSDNRLDVTLSDNTPEGLGLVEVQMRQGAGAWQNVATYNQAGGTALGQGRHHLAPDVSVAAIQDGTAEVRVVAHDPTFSTLLAATDPQSVHIDRLSPDASDLSGWMSQPTGVAGKYTLTLPTLADATSGLATVEVFANSNPSGLQGEAGFALAGATTTPTGTVTVTADLTGMAAGIHATRIRATDRAGNVFVTTGPVVVLDTSAPTVSPLAIAGNGIVSFTLSDAGGFGACPVRIELNGPGTNAAWRNVFEQAAGTLPGGFSFQLPMSGLANGDYSVRTTVCDAAGNTSTQTKVFTWTGGPSLAIPASANAAPPTPLAVNQVTQLSADGQVATRVVGGRILPVIRGLYNRPFVLRGQLQRADGTPLVGAGLELRDSAGRYITGARTDGLGAFAIPARATIGGIWTVNQVGQTDRTSAALLEVKPIVNVAMKMTGGPGGSRRLVVTGRLTPQAGAYNKALQLQWRDPSNGKWRPAVNGRVAKNGRFRIVYQFRRPGGYRVTFRVAVPTDNGWPYLATNSRGVSLKVS